MRLHRLIHAFTTALQSFESAVLRSVLSAVAVFVAFTPIVAVMAIGAGTVRYARSAVSTDPHQFYIRGALPDSLPRQLWAGSSVLTTLQAAVGRIGDVTFMHTRYVEFSSDESGHRASVRLVATTPDFFRLSPYNITSGNLSSQGIAAIALTRNAADALVISTIHGSVLHADGVKYVVTAIATARHDDSVPHAFVVGDSATMAMAGGSPALIARPHRVEDLDFMKDQLALAAREEFGVHIQFTTTQDAVEGVLRQIRAGRIAAGCLAGFALLVGLIGIANSLLASVVQRTHEIGIRRAAGARRLDIAQQFIAEGVLIATTGATAGVAGGYMAAMSLSVLVRRQTGMAITPFISFGETVIVAAAAVLTGVLAAVLPAYVATRITPAAAIRAE